MRGLLNKYTSTYGINMIKLITGTTLSQGINFLFNIYLARIYAPADFGEFYLFMNVLSLVFIFSTFKLDIEIVKSSNIEQLNNNIQWAYRINLFVSLIALILLVTFWKLGLFNLNNFSLLWILSSFIIVYMQTSVQILWMYSVKQKLFSFQSRYKILEALSLNILYVLFQGLGSIGLLLANIFNLVLSNFILILGLKKHLNFYEHLSNWIGIKNIQEIGRVFERQKFYIFQSILEVLQMSLIPFYISHDLVLVGYYSLTLRVLQVPMRFLSMPISQVFFSEIADRKISGKNMTKTFKKTLLMMCVISIPIILIILFWGPDLFSIIFGQKWRYSGELSQIFIWWIVLDFIKAPMMQVLYLYNKQRFVFFTLKFSVLILWLILELYRYLDISVNNVFMCISISQAVFIFFLIYKSYTVVRENEV